MTFDYGKMPRITLDEVTDDALRDHPKEWPWPTVDDAETMKEALKSMDVSVEEFRKSKLYATWVTRLPWLKEVS